MPRNLVPLGVVLLTGIVLVYPELHAVPGAEPPQVTPNAPTNQQALPAAQGAVPAAPPKVGDAVAFTSKDGKKKGWKVVIPGGRPLATPAIINGKVFIGGGFGSHEFYAFDAATGKKIWQYQTTDDGPTAAVVQDGYIAFNTESCEIEILALDGKPVWKKWLGDPLMSMPATSQGKIYMAYPDSKGDHQYYLACFDLKTGKEFWKKPIAGEIITAPVIQDDQVYLTTLEGTLYCFKQSDGSLTWKEKKNATSSPMVWNKQCFFSRREETTVAKAGKKVKQQTEQVAGRGLEAKDETRDYKETRRPADYLDYAKRANSVVETHLQAQDANVGFAGSAGGSKGSFKPTAALENVAQASVAGVWSYQGSRPFVYKDQLFSAMGDTVQCLDPRSQKVIWKQDLHPRKGNEKGELLDSVVTPPALANGKVFVGTAAGELLCLSVKTGEQLWSATIGEPVVFQPAVAGGRVYVSTSGGSLFCLETGDAKDDGWLMWGGNAAHNSVTVK